MSLFQFAKVLVSRIRSEHRYHLVSTSVYALVHAAFYHAGISFDDSTISYLFQYIDPVLLKERLWESLFYLHSQPPLFNLFVAAVVKGFPGSERLIFHILFLLMGYCSFLCLIRLMVKLGVSRAVALCLSTLFVLSPSFILYEHWLFYTFPVAFLLLVSANILWDYLEKGTRGHAFLFFFTLFLICGIRSLFHLLFFCLVTALVFAFLDRPKRKTLKFALIPFLLLFSMYLKNYYLFGNFSLSSWMGMSLWKVSVGNLSMDERKEMVGKGILSNVSLYEPFLILAPMGEGADVPVLTQVYKSTGHINFNHSRYIEISRLCFKDALTVIRSRPDVYARGIAKSWFQYFKPSSDNYFFLSKMEGFRAYRDVYEILFYGRVPLDLQRRGLLPSDSIRPEYTHLLLALGCVGLPFWGIGIALRSGSASLTRPQRQILLYLSLTILFVGFLGNAFESGENNRFRFMIDPFYIVLLGTVWSFFSRSVLLQIAIARCHSGKGGTPRKEQACFPSRTAVGRITAFR